MASSLPTSNANSRGATMWLSVLIELSKSRTAAVQKQIMSERLDGKFEQDLNEELGDEYDETLEARLESDGQLITKAIGGMSDLYSQAWNLGAGKSIISRLPQELCDMIYKELVLLPESDPDIYKASRFEYQHSGIADRKQPEDHELCRSTYTAYARYWRLRSADREMGFKVHGDYGIPFRRSDFVYRKKHSIHQRHYLPLSSEDYPHWFDPAYMGSLFAAGVSAKFHSVKMFTLMHPAELQGFLSSDRFGTTCVPSEHLRQMEICVGLGSFNTTTGNALGWTSQHFSEPQKQHYINAVKGLNALKTVSCRRGAIIKLIVECYSGAVCERFAETLYPLVYALKEGGWLVEIQAADVGAHRTGPIMINRYFDYSVDRRIWEVAEHNKSAFAKDPTISPR